MPARAKGRFECGYCGSAEIVIPEDPHDLSLVTCGSCERELATWAAVRSRLHDRAIEVSGKRERIKLREL